MNISFFSEDISFKINSPKKVQQWISNIVHSYSQEIGEISIIFVSDKKILEINIEHLNHDYFTDIITFDYSEQNTISGDLFISVDTVLSNSEKFHCNFNEELLRVIIHGVLHLIGFNDKTEKEQIEMTACENAALEIFNKE